MAKYRMSVPQMDDHAKALGYICITWGWLESSIDLIISELTPLPSAELSNCITCNADLRDKIQMAKAISFVQKPSDDWFDGLSHTLDEIDNKLRPERNRFIHDQWLGSTKGNPLKQTLKTQIKKPQAFQKILQTSEVIPVDSDDVWDLVRRIQEASVKLSMMMHEHPILQNKIRRTSD